MSRTTWFAAWGFVVCTILQLLVTDAIANAQSGKPEATIERFLPLAESGDPAIQHLLGFMYFYGEGVEQDYDEAHYWFHLSAEEGDAMAQRNLGIFHSRLLPRIPEKYYDPKEANLWFSLAAANSKDPEISAIASRSYSQFLAADAEKLLKENRQRYTGETIFVTFCAGCHGFDGRGPYQGAPSFALGERLKQSDRVLVDSILNGKDLMPAWGGTLSKKLAYETLTYIRRLNVGKTKVAQVSKQQLAYTKDSDLESGEKTYLQFCGGCHGFNGIAWYVNSPSFALRERMHKSDEELTYSIRNGRGAMPSWENMLQPDKINNLVKFIRTLAKTYENGIGNELRRPPALFFRFRPKGETGPEWDNADPLSRSIE